MENVDDSLPDCSNIFVFLFAPPPFFLLSAPKFQKRVEPCIYDIFPPDYHFVHFMIVVTLLFPSQTHRVPLSPPTSFPVPTTGGGTRISMKIEFE